VTGIATAFMDSQPMIAITGNVTSNLLGRDSFQEVDITGITMPITKHNYLVKSVDDLADTIRSAFAIAQSGRPGPVLIDIPKDITSQKALYRKSAPAPHQIDIPLAQAALEQAVRLLMQSKKPLVYAGGGVLKAEATSSLKSFAEKLDAPVAMSVMGLSSFPADHPLCVGMIGMHGSVASSRAAHECDLIIAIGARFSDRVAGNRTLFAPHARILHLDIDPSEINKNVKTHHHIIGDLNEVLTELSRLMGQQFHESWLARIRGWRSTTPQGPVTGGSRKVKPQNLLRLLKEHLADEAIMVTDVGQHQMWTAQYFPFTRPRTFLTSGGLGTMGFGLGAAIGAKNARPDRPVILITGDGSFHMNCNELATVVTYKLPIIILVMNNGALGMVRQWQKLFYKQRFSHTSPDRKTDFIKLAEAYGAAGYCIKTEDEIVPTFEKAFSHQGPVLIDCLISDDENVLPMIPPGATVQEMITEM
jgi:acetolactate synthase-1/2/3 large subunit